MKQTGTHITHRIRQAAATACLLLLSFVLYLQAFHHHHHAVERDPGTCIEKLSVSKDHCAICDHIVTRSVSGEADRFHYALTPPQPQLYNPYSYYITIARELFLQAYTNKGPPFNRTFIS